MNWFVVLGFAVAWSTLVLSVAVEGLKERTKRLETELRQLREQVGGAAVRRLLAVCAVLGLASACSGGSAAPVGTVDVVAPPEARHGAVNPNVTQANIASTICKSGWTSTIRPPLSYTAPIKRALWVKAGSKGKISDYELDHWVPLEVGGAPFDPANLVLQPWNGPTGAHAKDGVENRVKAEVCAGKITLAVGEQCFLVNWTRCP